MFKLYLVNHTRKEYCQLCRGNFSQERVPFIFPGDWGNFDEMEIMTEFIFAEKLKDKKHYSEIDMYGTPDSESDDEKSVREDQEHTRFDVLKDVSKMCSNCSKDITSDDEKSEEFIPVKNKKKNKKKQRSKKKDDNPPSDESWKNALENLDL